MTPVADPQIWWYISRAAGIVTWFLLAGSVLWGLLLATDLFPARRRPSWLLATHRWLGALSLWFLTIHLGSLVADSYVQFDITSLLVPLAATWKPVPVALGVLAMWALVAVEVTSLTIRRGHRRLWHGVHYVSYGAFWLASLHGTFAGTDASNPAYVYTSMLTVALTVAVIVYRILARRPRRRAAQGYSQAPGNDRPRSQRLSVGS